MNVAILLAAHNGLRWLPEQVLSILEQQNVDLHLFVSDDVSTDGTLDWLQELAVREDRVELLPARGPYRSAANNFYRLLRDADFSIADYVAFADQDDIWYPNKLAKAIAQLQERGANAASSNVIAVWPDTRRALVDKAQPQRDYDYLFEAAGPGCTYVMTAAFAREVRAQLALLVAEGVPLPAHHDWFSYALCRARGGLWVMDPTPSMDYRQHGGNEVGVNDGRKAAQDRLRKIKSGWYRTEVLGMLYLALALNPNDTKLTALARRLECGGLVDRLVLALQVGQFRRRWRDRWVLSIFFLSGWFWGRA